jgi:hypothetical protein
VVYSPLKLRFPEKAEILEQSTLQHQLTLGGLDKFQNYSVQVSAATKMGLGLKSRSVYCRTKEDGERMGCIVET